MGTGAQPRQEDLYPRIWEALDDPEIVATDPVRFEMMRYFGLFVTESSRHNAEYVPYFMQTEELRERFNLAAPGADDRRARP